MSLSHTGKNDRLAKVAIQSKQDIIESKQTSIESTQANIESTQANIDSKQASIESKQAGIESKFEALELKQGKEVKRLEEQQVKGSQRLEGMILAMDRTLQTEIQSNDASKAQIENIRAKIDKKPIGPDAIATTLDTLSKVLRGKDSDNVVEEISEQRSTVQYYQPIEDGFGGRPPLESGLDKDCLHTTRKGRKHLDGQDSWLGPLPN